MEIQYMQKLKDWDESKNWNSTGVEENRIVSLENKFHITFPIAYIEYLKISGSECPAIIQGHRFEFLEKRQDDAQYWLKEHALENLIKKPFWVIADTGGSFWYFHLDEGDNPPIYRLSPEYYSDYQDEQSFGKVANSFKDWIDGAIDRYEENSKN